jgi:hypothetical protein
MRYLKHNTAIEITIGPIIDWMDGKTLLVDNEAFDPAQIQCELIKPTGRSTLTLTKVGGDNNVNLTGTGMATLTLTAADTGSLGSLRLFFSNAVVEGFPTDIILPFVEDFEVLQPDVYETTAAYTQTIDEITHIPVDAENPFDAALINASADFKRAFGQQLVILPDGVIERPITAVVDYGDIEQVPGLQGKSQVITITVDNNAVTGLSAAEFDRAKAKVRIAERIGKNPVEKSILKILSQNAGWVKYQVQ